MRRNFDKPVSYQKKYVILVVTFAGWGSISTCMDICNVCLYLEPFDDPCFDWTLDLFWMFRFFSFKIEDKLTGF